MTNTTDQQVCSPLQQEMLLLLVIYTTVKMFFDHSSVKKKQGRNFNSSQKVGGKVLHKKTAAKIQPTGKVSSFDLQYFNLL